MKPIELEIIMRDSTRQGMQSVTGNMSVLEKCIQNNTLMLRQLEKALKDMQTQFAGSTKTVADQSENIAMMEALKKEVDELKAKLIELEKVKKMPPKNIPIELMPEINTPQFYKQVQLMVKQLEGDIAKAQVKASITIDGAVQQNEIAKIKTMSEELEKMNGILQKIEIQKKNTNEVPVVAPNAGKAAATQFNGLGMSIQQVARELPSLTMGANMFFLAISNNLPILADNIKQARTEYDLLKKSNQAATPVWKQVVSSIFSWQTAMVVGITLLTVYGKEIGEWVKELFRGKEALEQNRIAVESLSQARLKGTQSAQTELTRLKLLYQATQNDALGKREQLKAVKELQDKYPSYFGNLSAEEILAGNAAKAYKSLATAIIESAKARAYEDKIVENEKKILELDNKRIGALVKETKAKQRFDKANTLLENLEGNSEAYDYQLTTVGKARDKMNEYGNEAKRTANEIDELRKANEKLAGKVKPTDLLFEEKPTKETKGDTTSLSVDNLSSADLKARQKIEAMKIAIMAEGAAKEKKEARARFDAELARIDQEEKERLTALAKSKKQGLPVSKEQVTAVTDQSGQQRKLASQVYVKEFFDVEKEYADKQKKDFDKLLEKYQDYTAQRVDIEKTFNADIALLQAERDAAQQKGDTEKVDQINRAIAQATTNKGKDLMGLDYEKLKQAPEYVRAFENLKETSSDTLDSLLSQLESAKQTAAEVLSPDQLREYTTTIQEIMDELDSRNPFGALADRKKELAEAEAELATAQQQLNAVQGGAQIVTGVKNTKYNDKTGKIESEKTYLTTTKAMEKYNKAQDDVAKKGTKAKKAEKEVKDVMDDLFDSIKEVGDAIGGPAGEIIGLIGDIGSFTMFAMEGIKAVADTSANAISQVEKASVILAIISAAIQVATKIASLFKGEDEEEMRKKYIEQLNGVVDIYDKIIEKQKESIKFGYGFSAIESAKKAMEELNKQTEVYRKIAYEAGNELMSFSKMNTWAGIVKEMGIEAHGDDLLSSRLMSSLTGEQLSIIRDKYKEFWVSLPEEQQKALQAIIDAGEKGEDVIDAWQESIAGISYESFYDEFIDTLSDMDMSAADMAENFGEYLRKSILAAMVAKNFQKDISSLYEMWVAAAGDKSDGGIDITKNESDSIQKKYKELVEAMTAARDNMANSFGWESGATSQSGKAGALTTITQDQGTKLEGLFSMLQIHTKDIDDTVKDIAMAMYEAFDVLLRIEANTAYCRHLEQMAEDIAELKRDGFKMK